MKIKTDWTATITALAITIGALAFPFANTCQSEDARVCTWHAETSGNGSGVSFTDFYGVTLYHP